MGRPVRRPRLCALDPRAGLLAAVVFAAGLLAGPMPACAATAAAHVRLVIDMRQEIAAGRFDPLHDGVGLRGGTPPLSWQRTLAAGAGPAPGLYMLMLSFTERPYGGQGVPYRFKVERAGEPNAGWEPGRNRRLPLPSDGAGPRQQQRAWGGAGDDVALQRSGRIERHAPRPSAHVAAREVQVWLPPGYDELPARRYPVLYLHDGQNVFDAFAAGAEWQVDETAQRLVLAGTVAPMIVVAVASTPARIADYTPLPRAPGPPRLAGGGAAAYGRYLVHELKPWIDARYRTRPGRGDTAVGGSSLGGLVSVWLLLEHAPTFGAALVVSPSVWWAGQAIVRQAAAARSPLPPPRVWLDIGDREGEDAVQGARRLHEALQRRGWPVAYLEAPDGDHDEASWAARVEPMLRFLYGTPSSP